MSCTKIAHSCRLGIHSAAKIVRRIILYKLLESELTGFCIEFPNCEKSTVKLYSRFPIWQINIAPDIVKHGDAAVKQSY